MNAAFQHWFYGEDGMNPVSRIRGLHKVSIVLLALAAYFSFFELEFDSLGMQLYGTAAFFTLGFGVWRRGLPLVSGGYHRGRSGRQI